MDKRPKFNDEEQANGYWRLRAGRFHAQEAAKAAEDKRKAQKAQNRERSHK